MWQLASIFVVVFVAELGDKTQLATVLFASEGRHHPLAVFAAAALALCVSTGAAVFLGSVFAQRLEGVPLKLISGIGFLVIGAWTIVDHLRG